MKSFNVKIGEASCVLYTPDHHPVSSTSVEWYFNITCHASAARARSYQERKKHCERCKTVPEIMCIIEFKQNTVSIAVT